MFFQISFLLSGNKNQIHVSLLLLCQEVKQGSAPNSSRSSTVHAGANISLGVWVRPHVAVGSPLGARWSGVWAFCAVVQV